MAVDDAVVLAAGEGQRLRPLTSNRPKPMLPAGNRPILAHVLDALVDAGIQRLVLVVGYRRQRVQEFVGHSYRGTPVEYVVQEKQLGSGHALLQAREAVAGPTIVVNGDHLIEADAVDSVASEFDANSAGAAVAIIERPDAHKYGAVELADRDIVSIVEKPDSDDYRLINAGIYAFDDQVFSAIDETPRAAGELALTDVISRYVDKHRVRGVHVGGLWTDATYPWDLLSVAGDVLDHGRVEEPERREGVWIHDDAVVDDRATLIPPVVVSADCEIGAGSVVGPTVALGNNATVGANVVIERSVLDADTRVGHSSTLVDAVVSQGVHLGVDVTVPGGPSTVRVGQAVFADQALGAVLADRVTVGAAASFAPGTLVGPHASVGTATHVSSNVADGAEVVR